jgi:hypothetical protein
LGTETVGVVQVRGQAAEVFAEVDSAQVLGLVEHFVNQSHHLDAVLADLEYLEGPLVLDVSGLQAEKAGDDLQIVLDPVVDFLDEHLFLVERSSEPVLGQ